MPSKWFKPDSEFANGSRGRVSANLAAQREAAERAVAQADAAAAEVAKRQRQANPRSRADKTVIRKGGGG